MGGPELLGACRPPAPHLPLSPPYLPLPPTTPHYLPIPPYTSPYFPISQTLGSFTVYLQPDFDKLTAEHAAELFAINTAPLPAIRAPLPPRIRSADPAADGRAADDSDAPISDAGGASPPLRRQRYRLVLEP